MKPKQSLWRKETSIQADKGFYFDTSIPPIVQWIEDEKESKIVVTFWQRKMKVKK